jgi:hypothetical protein
LTSRRGSFVDALTYGASALVAGGTALFASIPLYREAGRIAAGPYAAGAGIALFLAIRRSGWRWRMALAGLVLAGALLLPLSLEVTWRSHTAPGLHAQSEAIVTEEAAKALVHGHDPYATSYLHGPLAARPLGTKTHFPYLPAMLVFGLPRAFAGSRAWTDARVGFAFATLAVLALVAWRWRQPPERTIRLIQVMAIIPIAGLLMVAGGDDLPVVALMVLSLVLASNGRPGWSGAVAGLAAATKQTAWVLIPFLIAGLLINEGRRAAVRAGAALLAVSLVVIVPFVVWNPGAFVEDVIRFPLGLGKQRSAAETPTLGSLLVRVLPSARTLITVLLVAVVAAITLVLLAVRPPRSIRGAAVRAAVVFLVAMALVPAGRIGYIVYPIDLVAWAWLGRTRPVRPGPAEANRMDTRALAA